METYTKDFWQTPHKAMSILYRPLTRKWGDAYTIEPYTAKEDADAFLDMPAPWWQVPCFFFGLRAQTTERFAVLFDEYGEGGDEFATKWGWYPVLYALAGEDILKMDEVTSFPVGHAFTHLAYLKDLNYKGNNNTVNA